MSELRLAVMREDIPSSSPISCGIASIDDRIKDAYSKTICKQGLAYNIYVDGYLIGNCMIKLVVLCDEANDYMIFLNLQIILISPIYVSETPFCRKLGRNYLILPRAQI